MSHKSTFSLERVGLTVSISLDLLNIVTLLSGMVAAESNIQILNRKEKEVGSPVYTCFVSYVSSKVFRPLMTVVELDAT